jgi:hypothetical protein
MKRYAWLIAVATLALASGAETADSDKKAVAIADQVMKALGGEKQWNDLEGIRWSFGSEVGDTVKSLRRHSWDKHTGWHRVEGKNRAGLPFVFIENINDSTTGMAWMSGTPIEGDSLHKLMKTAKRMWTNDTYWMLMPYKLRDPGVRLNYEGKAKVGDVDYDKVALSFDHVGQTPGDRYWIYVNPKNHRIERWDYLLEGDQPPAQTITWEGWQESHGLWFPTAHRRDNLNVFTRDVEAVASFPPGEFTAP